MKTINRSIGDVFREVGQASMSVLRHSMRTLSRMSWPALLASCVMLALLLTILPLALTLFVIFLLLKLAVAVIGNYSHSKKHDHQARQEY